MKRLRASVALAACLALTATSVPAQAAPALALPETVRINISGNGATYAVFGATTTLAATAPDGTEIYRGLGRVVVRTDVRRLADGDTELPPRTPGVLTPEERLSRAELLREARLAERTAARAIVRIPFEVSSLRDLDDDLGRPVLCADRIRALRFAAPDGGLLNYNGRLYRGTFELLERDGRFLVINALPTRPYLVSVIGTEIPSDWHRQALAAQAVAARTYLLKHLGSHGAYDLEGDEQDQAYGGFRGEVPQSARAVAETEGLVLTYRGAVIDAFYSANAGGQTEASEDVWVTPLPYLRSVPSPGDTAALTSWWGASSYEWKKEYTEPALRRQLQRFGINVGTLLAIDVLERGAGGGVVRARIRGARAQVTSSRTAPAASSASGASSSPSPSTRPTSASSSSSRTTRSTASSRTSRRRSASPSSTGSAPSASRRSSRRTPRPATAPSWLPGSRRLATSTVCRRESSSAGRGTGTASACRSGACRAWPSRAPATPRSSSTTTGGSS